MALLCARERLLKNMPTHVDLDRTFWALGDREEFDPDIQRAHAAFGLLGTSWDELLKNPRVVILAEAGAGKTHEMQAKAAGLKAQDRAAFFCRLESRTCHFLGKIRIR